MEYAGFWRRVVAAIIDGLLITFVVVLIGIALGVGIFVSGIDEESAGAVNFEAIGLANQLFWIVAVWLYFAVMESSKLQGTLGKMLIGVVVTDLEGNRVSFARATGRYFGKFVSSLILMIGYIMVAFTERKQALHDIMAKCLVIRKPRAA